MANINLSMLEETGVTYDLRGLKILIYGGNTLGKTPQSMKFPKPLLLMGESGGSALKGYKLPMNKKKDFLDVVKQLTDEKTIDKMQEKFQTIVIDCIEDIVELFETALCREFGVRDVGEIQHLEKGNPNGYSVYRKEFKQQINLLTSAGYTIIFIAHEETLEIEEGVFFIQPKGSKGDKSSSRFIRDLCDFRFYIKGNGIDPETKKTIMSTAWCVETDEFYAGSRFNVQSFVNPFTADNLIKAIEEAQKRTAEEQDANLEVFTPNTSDYTLDDYMECIKPYVVKLNPLFPDQVRDIIASQLGEKVRVSEATEDQLIELETIYTKLVDFACVRGIVV
jgi:hypothetical protein